MRVGVVCEMPARSEGERGQERGREGKHRSAQKTYLEDDEGEEEGMRDIGWLVGRRMGTKALTGVLLGWCGGCR